MLPIKKDTGELVKWPMSPEVVYKRLIVPVLL